MPTVAVTDSSDLLAAGVQRLEREADLDVRVLPWGLTPIEAARQVADAQAILIGIMPFPAEAIDELKATGLIIRCGIGVDIVDIDRAAKRGIRVANVPDYCCTEVADHTLMLLLMAVRRARHFQSAWENDRRWAEQVYEPVPRLAGRTIGLVGIGRIGSLVAQRAQGFGMNVIAVDSAIADTRLTEMGVQRATFDEVLAESDIVSLHLPMNAVTSHIIDRAALAKMRPGSILINTSRGGLVDLDALGGALASGRLAAAGLDVVEGEPTPDPAHPVLAHPNAIVTPHVAWYSTDARQDLGVKAAENAIGFVRGESALHVVNGVE